jgi:predicted dehydrogenase
MSIIAPIRDIRIAIVGCGPVVAQRYIPSLKKLKWIPTALFDTSAERRRPIAAMLGTRPVEADHPSSALDSFDAAIVEAPLALHAERCVELLQAGKHVLVEKPMATTGAACAEINRAAIEGRARIAVALMRRYAPGARWLKEAIDASALGRLKRFVMREGYDNWPLLTECMWRRQNAGGGALSDAGAHALDQIMWWFGAPSAVEYWDDVDGDDGVEANCLVRMGWPSGLEGEIELSRSRLLSNRLTIETEKGALSLATSGNLIESPGEAIGDGSSRMVTPRFKTINWSDLFQEQLVQFRAYAAGQPAIVVTGEEAAQSVDLIQRCYAARRPLDLPWIQYSVRKHA